MLVCFLSCNLFLSDYGTKQIINALFSNFDRILKLDLFLSCEKMIQEKSMLV